MNLIPAVLGSLGGIIVFCGAAYTIIRGTVRQADATDRNTKAIQNLEKGITDLKDEVNLLKGRLS